MRVLGILLFASLVCQLFGNVAFQWSLGIVGIALTVPITLGAMIISGAMMGRVFLHESVTLRMALSLVVLIAAICVLSLGAGEASSSILDAATSQSLWLIIAGVGRGLPVRDFVLTARRRDSLRGHRAGIGCFHAGYRHSDGRRKSGSLEFGEIGWQGMWATGSRDFTVMTAAGIFNAVAFLALTKSLATGSGDLRKRSERHASHDGRAGRRVVVLGTVVGGLVVRSCLDGGRFDDDAEATLHGRQSNRPDQNPSSPWGRRVRCRRRCRSGSRCTRRNLVKLGSVPLLANSMTAAEPGPLSLVGLRHGDRTSKLCCPRFGPPSSRLEYTDDRQHEPSGETQP